MEDILRPLYQERASWPSTLGILLVEKKPNDISSTDTFDYILLAIVNDAEDPVFIKHYIYNDKKAALHVVHEAQLREWILLGSNRKIIEWIFNGKIVFDRNEFVENLKSELREFPFYGRKIKTGVEFAKLIRRYLDGKSFFENGHYLDAYNHVIHSLHHLARLEIIDQGFYPEVTVWNQVKMIRPEIFKLYEELVTSQESLGKRLELLFLASEFLIHSRTHLGSQHIIDVLRSREGYWTIAELSNLPELEFYSVDLEVLLEYLVDKHLIEVCKIETKGQGIYHRYYAVSQDE
ncbi:nucleotidyltransferase-like protein [Peribacillus kribbensis]|uniref:nucleotidyltransferase-like protein n=1 Tax=Peribacillus kribbensis TaxID=356658 RepID=UPI0004025EA3|nr:nucleotidyltransferase-like protein [Peribacillus kribbensis]